MLKLNTINDQYYKLFILIHGSHFPVELCAVWSRRGGGKLSRLYGKLSRVNFMFT